MVIDAAKGIEAQTLKLFEVCRLRDVPIITLVNKMDREARGSLRLDGRDRRHPADRGDPGELAHRHGEPLSRLLRHRSRSPRAHEAKQGRAARGRHRVRGARRSQARRAASRERLRPAARRGGDGAPASAPSSPSTTTARATSPRCTSGARSTASACASCWMAWSISRHRPRPQPVQVIGGEAREVSPQEEKTTAFVFKIQGEHGSQTPRPHRLREAVLGALSPRHEDVSPRAARRR